jgi:hypothetical protein
VTELRNEMAASPDRQSLSDESRRKLDGVFDVANGIMRGERADFSGPTDWRITDPKKIAQFAASPEFAAGLERIKGEISSEGPARLAAVANYTTSGQLELDVAAKLPEAIEAATDLTKGPTNSNLEQFLELPGMHAALESFGGREFSGENLAFLDVTKEYESTVKGLSIGDDTAQNRNSLDETLAQARSIIDEFIHDDGDRKVNLPNAQNNYGTQKATIERFEKIAARMGEFDGSEDPIELAEEIKRDLVHLFTRPEGSTSAGSDPRTEITALLRRDTLARFFDSPEFKVAVENNLRNELASTFRDSLEV